MKHLEIFRLACLSVGIEDEAARAAVAAYARMVSPPVGGAALEIESLIASRFDFKKPPTRRMTATEVCRAVGIAHPTRAQQTAAGVALTALTKRRAMKTNGRHVYVMPAE